MLREPVEAERRARDVAVVDTASGHQHVHDGERQGGVGARAHHQVLVGLLSGRSPVGIDRDDVGAAGPGLLHERHHVDRRVRRVHAPEHDQVGADHLLGVVARDGADGRPPAGVGRRHADRPVEPARAERVEERVARVVLHLPHRARVRKRQDGLGAVGRDDGAPALGDRRHRVVPRDRDELAGSLRPDPAQRPQHAKRRVDALGVLAHLAANHALGERMVRIAGDGRQPTAVDGHHETAARRAIVRTNRQHVVSAKVSWPRMRAWLERFNPFKTPEAKRFAILFGVVYFAQGMWYLPNQTITIVLKDRGLSASQVADLTLITIVPWFVKPLYGLLSDFVPLFGRRRQSYFLVTSALAGCAGLLLAWGNWFATGEIWTFDVFGFTFTLVEGVALFTLMALGLAFTDVLTDAMMVERGRPLGLTGAFQSVQWACITLASVLVGEIGGQLAEARSLRAAFLLAA